MGVVIPPNDPAPRPGADKVRIETMALSPGSVQTAG